MFRRVLGRKVLLGLLAAAVFPVSAHAADQLVKVGSFDQPVYIAAPPGDQQRLMVVEQPGRIRLLVNGQEQAAPFLDISGEVRAPGGEQGLLSMAFDPNYAATGRFYVYYTSRQNCDSDGGCDEHVSEFTRSASNPNVANPASERLLMAIPHPHQTNHNGGQLQFGPDGYLYISTGDGGGSNDQERNAQKTDSAHLLGKILRIDPFHGSPYSVPAGNPFGPGNPIYAYGLRNPWRFSFDRANGDMVIGDVGQDNWEEIDYAHPGQNAGANYGWSCFEGTHVNPDAQDSCSPLPSPVVGPVWQYSHDCGTTPFCGQGIIGGYVVRDPSLTDLYGRYVYGDLSSSGSSGLRSIALGFPAGDDRSLPLDVPTLSSFGEDAAGHVYVASVGNGGVWRIAAVGASPPASGDRRAPRLRLSFNRRQRILRSHAIRLTVLATERAALTAIATVNVGRSARVVRFKRTRRTLRAHRRVRVQLRLSRRSLNQLRRAFRHHRSFVARVTLTARDGAGNRVNRRTSIRLTR